MLHSKNGTVYKNMLLNADDARLVAGNTDDGITCHEYGKNIDHYPIVADINLN